jgi:hypothetical protein
LWRERQQHVYFTIRCKGSAREEGGLSTNDVSISPETAMLKLGFRIIGEYVYQGVVDCTSLPRALPKFVKQEAQARFV